MRYSILLLLTPALVPAQRQAPKNTIVEGVVVNSLNGAPIPGARVKLSLEDNHYAKADADGHFSFQASPGGSFRIDAESPGFQRLSLTIYTFGKIADRCGNSPENLQQSTDSDGNSHAAVTLRLVPYGVITGKITGPDGYPIERGSIEIRRIRPVERTCSSPPASAQLMYQTNERGEFRIAHLDPGPYIIVANKPLGLEGWDKTYRPTYYPHAIDAASAKPIEVAGGEEVHADIQILSVGGVHVSGRLIKPVADGQTAKSSLYTTVGLVPLDSQLLNNNLTTGGTVDYLFNDVLPGKYTLIAVTRDPSSDHAEVFGLTRTIEVGPNGTDNLDLELRTVHDLSGVVTFQEGCTPSQVRIQALSQRNPIIFRSIEATSGIDGKFVLSGLAGGNFNISVRNMDRFGGVPVASIRLGDTDVSKAGIDAPLSSGDPLRIEAGCGNRRKQQ